MMPALFLIIIIIIILIIIKKYLYIPFNNLPMTALILGLYYSSL